MTAESHSYIHPGVSGSSLAAFSPSWSRLRCPVRAPEAKASPEAATLPSSSDTCPAPQPHPEGGLTPSHSLWGQKDLQDRKHPGLQKDPVRKEEAKVRGQHRRAPGWEAFLNGYIHWELAGTCICSPTPSPMPLPWAPPSDPEEVQARTFLRIIPSHFSSLGNSSGPCRVGGPGEPSTDNSTHRGAGQTLQTGEATVSLQSPLASLSSFSLVTSGALRALGTRHTDTGWVSSAQSKSPLPASPAPRSPRSLRDPPLCPLPPSLPVRTQHRALRYSLAFPGLQQVLRVPWDLVRPVGRVGATSESSQGKDGPLPRLPMAWAPRQLLHSPDPGLSLGPGAGQGRVGGGEELPAHPATLLHHGLLLTQDTHSFSSVSLLANWAGGARRARGPGSSRGTCSASLSTVTLSGERSQAQRGISRGGKEGRGSVPDPARLKKCPSHPTARDTHLDSSRAISAWGAVSTGASLCKGEQTPSELPTIPVLPQEPRFIPPTVQPKLSHLASSCRPPVHPALSLPGLLSLVTTFPSHLGTWAWPTLSPPSSRAPPSPQWDPLLTSRPGSPAGPVRPGGPTGPGGPRSPDAPGAPCLPGSPWGQRQGG